MNRRLDLSFYSMAVSRECSLWLDTRRRQNFRLSKLLARKVLKISIYYIERTREAIQVPKSGSEKFSPKKIRHRNSLKAIKLLQVDSFVVEKNSQK